MGFDNDFSQTPAVESDVIRFDVNYSDTSKKYADGTAYDGIIRGQKKILRYTTQSGTVSYSNGNYQCTSSATGRLSYPQKYLLKIVVDKAGSDGTISFSNITSDSSATITGTQTITEQKEFYIIPSQMSGTYVDFTMTNIKLISAELTNRPFEMKDGVAEYKKLEVPEHGIYLDLLKQALDGKLNYNIDGTETDSSNTVMRYGSDETGNIENMGIKYGGGSSSLSDWQDTGKLPEGLRDADWYSVCYGEVNGQGMFVAVVNGSQYGAYSSDGINWTEMDMKTSKDWYSVCYGEVNGQGMFVAVAYGSQYGAYCDVKEKTPSWYFYNNSGNDSTNHHFIFSNYRGDMYFATNADPATYSFDLGSTYLNLNNGAETKYLGSGIFRWTRSSEQMLWDTDVSPNIYDFKWEVKNLGTTQLPTLYAGATLPINTALFYGADGTKQYNYEWQSSNGTWNGKDATAAVKLVTKEACEKLKKNNNLRVYLIKYRKQEKYKHPVTQAETSFDYDYLNDCATGTSTPYLYENVADEAGLKSALDAIYTNIKNWAGYTEARNVVN